MKKWGPMENIKFSVKRRKGTAFPLEIKITGFQEKRKKRSTSIFSVTN